MLRTSPWTSEAPQQSTDAKKLHGEGTYPNIQIYIYTQTSRLLDRIGPVVGRFGEKSFSKARSGKILHIPLFSLIKAHAKILHRHTCF